MVSLNKFKSQLGKFVYHYIIKYIVTQCSEKKYKIEIHRRMKDVRKVT